MEQSSISIATYRRSIYILMAILTVSIWGVTFVSTKVLINSGMTPVFIFISRFAIAYLCMAVICHKKLLANSMRDELLMAAAGITGGSLYFITENTALELTFASDVSLIICTAPILTMLLARCILHQPLRRGMFVGSLLALLGVALVVFNGTFNLGVSPLGDLLTLAAALSWAIYCIILKVVETRYSTLYITRKVFGYGLLSALMIQILNPAALDISVYTNPVVWGNLLFLGLVASMLCFLMWNKAVQVLGAGKASNFIYLTPLVTILSAILFLGEPFTAYTALGTILILGGVYIAER